MLMSWFLMNETQLSVVWPPMWGLKFTGRNLNLVRVEGVLQKNMLLKMQYNS